MVYTKELWDGGEFSEQVQLWNSYFLKVSGTGYNDYSASIK